MPTENEFREIGHSGGRFTVTSKTQEDGRRTFQLGWSSSRPVPQSIITVQVNFSGDVLGVSTLSWAPDRAGENTGPTDNFPVFVASDREGSFGHQCRHCDTYWRSDGYPANWPMTCPRCGLRQPSHGFLTDGQLKFIGAVLEKVNEALENEEDGEYTIDMDAISDDIQDGAEVPDFYYAEESQQCRFQCTICGSRNDILGKYGHCSCCGYRNNLKILRDEIDGILGTLESGSSPEDCVKLLVSTFDSCGKNYLISLVERTPLTPARKNSCGRILFHNVDRAPDLIRTYFDIRLLKGLDAEDIEFLNLLFHRRHVYEHRGGVADQRYLDEAGETSIRLGQSLRETSPNVKRFGELLKKMATNFDEGYHQIFPPDEKAVQVCGPRVAS